MLFRVLFALVFFSVFLLASDFGRMSAFALHDVNATHGKIKFSALKVGESGSVVRWFDKEHSAIIARGTVESVSNEQAVLRFQIFDSLAQKALPIPKVPPKNGDEIYMKYFYDRALLIAPNQEIYQKISQSYKNTTWIHPDLFLSQIMLKGNFAPKKNDFKSFCNQYSVGVVYFVNGTKGELRDCQTFALLQSDYITGKVKSKDVIRPFYSRFETVESSFLAVASEDVEDYYSYFDALLSNQNTDGSTVSGIGKEIAKSVVEFFEDF